MDLVHIRDFQSLLDVELKLAPFTVLTGPSNSGKSAVLRAIRAVVHNVSSPATIVRHGAKKAEVVLGPFNISGIPEDDFRVLFERGKALSQYTLVRRGREQVYAKAGTSVPEPLQRLFRFVEVEGESLNFALQFDRPFLLDAPATKVAKVLGDLTGINVIFDAVREANRRRLDVTSKLKVRRSDLDDIRARAADYENVGVQHEAVQHAVNHYWEAVRLNTRLDSVVKAIDVVEKAEAVLAQLHELPEPPGLEVLDKAARAILMLDSVIETVEFQQPTNIATAEQAIETLAAQIQELDAQYHDTLIEGGTCPTCGAVLTKTVS